MVLRKGYDYFPRDPGEDDEVLCRVCGVKCDVQRNVAGATSFAGTMTKSKILHDSFSCSHSEEKWHEQARSIMEEMDRTASPSLKEILNGDVDKIVLDWKRSEIK